MGLSGGLDSTVLLHVLASLLAGRILDSPGSVTAVHVNHGLHHQADLWQTRCATLAASLGVPLIVRRVTVSGRGSLEAAARNARYQAFAALLTRPGQRLLLAHHRDDQVETALLRLFQGRGLYGMPHARPLGAGRLLRPLLDVPRSALEDYARGRSLSWVEDPANADLGMDRNYLRHRVLPVLQQRWPEMAAGVLDAMVRAHLADQALYRELAEASPDGALPLDMLQGRTVHEQVVMLRLWLQSRDVPVPGRAALQEFLRQTVDAAADRQPQLTLSGSWLKRHGGHIHLAAPPPQLAPQYPMPVPGELELPHGRLRVVADPDGFQPRGSVVVRFRRGGEALIRHGRTRSVKQLMQEAAVPPWLRSSYPLLFDDQGLLALPNIAWRDAQAPDGVQGYRADWQTAQREPAAASP